MVYTHSQWNGFQKLDFEFEGHKAILVLPHKAVEGNKWLLKTEYFDAFPSFEIEMVEKGYHLAYVESETRWHGKGDDGLKERFCAFLQEKFDLCEKCLPVGMSCGGLQAVYFAAAHPERVAALYLDAPVLNFLSCPVGVGIGTDLMYFEFVQKTGLTKEDLINYRNHPMDQIPKLLAAKLPVMLICGSTDYVVPYKENGAVFYERYKEQGGDITLILKPGCGHHPHGLEDNAPLHEFAAKYY